MIHWVLTRGNETKSRIFEKRKIVRGKFCIFSFLWNYWLLVHPSVVFNTYFCLLHSVIWKLDLHTIYLSLWITLELIHLIKYFALYWLLHINSRSKAQSNRTAMISWQCSRSGERYVVCVLPGWYFAHVLQKGWADWLCHHVPCQSTTSFSHPSDNSKAFCPLKVWFDL